MGRGSAQGRCASAQPESLAEEEIRRRADCESAVLCGVPRVIHGCRGLTSVFDRSSGSRPSSERRASRDPQPHPARGWGPSAMPGARRPRAAHRGERQGRRTHHSYRAARGRGAGAPHTCAAVNLRNHEPSGGHKGTTPAPQIDTFDIAQKNQLRRQSRVDVITRSTGPSPPTPWKHPALPFGGNAGGSPQRAKTQRRV